MPQNHERTVVPNARFWADYVLSFPVCDRAVRVGSGGIGDPADARHDAVGLDLGAETAAEAHSCQTPAETCGPRSAPSAIRCPTAGTRLLLRRAERRRARQEGRAPRALSETDVLLLADDEARQGALRFDTDPTGPFLAEAGHARIPPFVELPPARRRGSLHREHGKR